MENEEKIIFAFDVGTASLASCVRRGKEILDLSVDLLPAEYASVKDARERRRQIRTRMAHKQREKWWKEQAAKAGIEVPETGHLNENGEFIKPDERMSREFPADGDNTIYNSALLRIALLRGKELEGWQIFKAIWSAIQHRGFDSNLPWKKEQKDGRKNRSRKKDDLDEKANSEGVANYLRRLEEIFKGNKDFYYPCYYEAHTMGIWDFNDPDNLSGRIKNNPDPVRNKNGKVNLIIPRELVEKEIHDMLEQAGKKYPYIKENLKSIMYGPGLKMYAAFKDRRYRKYLGKDWEWQGLLAQKTPRFSNRIISKCVLMPRLNVCKANDRLNKEVVFLMKLKNMRYFLKNGGEERSLTPDEIKDIFEKFKEKLAIGKEEWRKYLEQKNAIPAPSQTKVEASKADGRSSFCRPALRILKEILLSGESPHSYREKLLEQNTNTDPKKGLVPSDYGFLLRMPQEWDKFHIPDERVEDEELSDKEREEKINKIIREITNPVVRHRLEMFYRKLKKMSENFGKPDKVIVEFVRDPEESLMGKDAKEKFIKNQKDNEEKNRLARKKAGELGLKGGDAILKLQLYEEQKYLDVYDGKPIKETEIGEYQIDHIVPRSSGGPDSYINKVLTSRNNNSEKGDRTPYEWLKNKSEEWEAYVERVKGFEKMNEKKKKLLTSAEAQTLVEKYTHLAETSYISRLSQKIVHLHFNWSQLTEGSTRRFFVTNGGQTARMRRRYDLDRLLYPHMSDEEYKKMKYSQNEEDSKGKKKNDKNRDNPRHHALDAILISMFPEIKSNNRGKDFYPVWFNRDYCKIALDKCFPRNIRYEKPVLSDTIYGLREIKAGDEHKYVFVSRYSEKGGTIESYYDIEVARKKVDKIFSPQIQKDFKEKLEENPTKEEWKQFLDNYFAGGKPKKLLLRASGEFEKEEVEKFLKGEIKNLGEFIKGKMNGQYLKQKKESYGYFVYKNDKGEWIREPVYAFESLFKKGKEIKERHKEAYYFRSGMLVEIQRDFEVKGYGGKITRISEGKYYLRSILDSKQCKIEPIDASKELPLIHIKYLMEEGSMRPIS